jgi:hypothetical protein
MSEHDRARPTCPKCVSQNVVQSLSTVFVQTSKES